MQVLSNIIRYDHMGLPYNMRKEHTTMENKKRTDGKGKDENEVQKTISDWKHQLGMHGRSLGTQEKKMKEGEVEEDTTFKNRNRHGQTSESCAGGTDRNNERTMFWTTASLTMEFYCVLLK